MEKLLEFPLFWTGIVTEFSSFGWKNISLCITKINPNCRKRSWIYESKSVHTLNIKLDDVAIFMGCYETRWLNEYNLNKSKFYLRCVDDILATFDNTKDPLNVLNFHNKKHSHIKLAIKKTLIISSLFLVYSFQIIKIRYFKCITNRPILKF